MKRPLILSSKFLRLANRLVKQNRAVAPAIRAALELLEEDIFDPRLAAHKLEGVMEGSWSCTAGYD